MKRTEEQLDAKQILSVIEKYSLALDLLDAYDHQNMKRPEGGNTIYILSYEECRKVIDSMSYGEYSNVFGNEKDDSFKGSIGAIYQTFAGQEVYPSLEEKAANLLYFIMDRNQALFLDDEKIISDHTLVALTIMIAESRPEEKEMMISVIMNCLK